MSSAIENYNTVTTDSIIGGFTVITEKVQPRLLNVQEILPFWISNSIKFPADLNQSYSMDKISKMSEFLKLRLNEMGIIQLFPVQFTLIPYILDCYFTSKYRPLCRPRDICICAPTGSGKTLAYTIPIVQLLMSRVHRCIRALIIVPVRDLAVQVYKIISQLVLGTDIKVGVLAGIQSFNKEQEDIIDTTTESYTAKVDIVVATPGRLVDHLYNTPGFSMERLRILVIDEADRVIVEEKQNWYRTLEDVLYYYTSSTNQSNWSTVTTRKRCRPLPTIGYHYDRSGDVTLQKILVSATLTHDPEPLKQFSLYFPILFTSDQTYPIVENKMLTNTTTTTTTTTNTSKAKERIKKNDVEKTIDNIQLKKNESSTPATTTITTTSGGVGVGEFFTPQNLQEFLVTTKPDIRVLFLVHLIRQMHKKRILCFTNTTNCAKRLNMLLTNFQDIHSKFLSSHLHPDKRQRILNSFSNGMCQILVCTDAMARGMDIEDVECVVSYDVPPSIKTYIHRIGRTARAGKKGMAYTLLSNNQFHHFKKDLKRVGHKKIKQLQFHQSQWSQFNAEYQIALRNYENHIKSLGKNSSVMSAKQDGHNRNISENGLQKTNNTKVKHKKNKRMLDENFKKT
ncbi:unnamed protein product [Heterobilharzia americana]|nr:unnamed protein product [Heterobilharzia americana]